MGQRKGCSKPPGSGKKKGSFNKDKALVRDQIAEAGFDLIEGLIAFAQGDWEALEYESEKIVTHGNGFTNEAYTIPPELRFSAMKELMKYAYPQLKSIEAQVNAKVEERPLQHLSDEELDKL